MKLSVWAKKNGLTYKTAYRLWCAGNLPVDAEQLATGTILVHEDTENQQKSFKAVLYARVSSHDQKQDLQAQIQRLRKFAASRGIQISKEVSEIGSGLNGKRHKLKQLLINPDISPIIVEHSDRLARFGVPFIEAVLNATGRELLVMNKAECKDDIVQDFIDLATSMCARIYGRRSAANRAQRAVAAAAKK